MKRIILFIAIIILVIVSGFFLFNNKSSDTVVEQKPITIIAEIEAVDGQIIDVREPSA